MITWPDCIINHPHIIADPCQPRWVVRCEHGYWFYSNNQLWLDKRDEFGAHVALLGLLTKVIKHTDYWVGSTPSNTIFL